MSEIVNVDHVNNVSDRFTRNVGAISFFTGLTILVLEVSKILQNKALDDFDKSMLGFGTLAILGGLSRLRSRELLRKEE